mgnify:CR=1 FL=1
MTDDRNWFRKTADEIADFVEDNPAVDLAFTLLGADEHRESPSDESKLDAVYDYMTKQQEEASKPTTQKIPIRGDAEQSPTAFVDRSEKPPTEVTGKQEGSYMQSQLAKLSQEQIERIFNFVVKGKGQFDMDSNMYASKYAQGKRT